MNIKEYLKKNRILGYLLFVLGNWYYNKVVCCVKELLACLRHWGFITNANCKALKDLKNIHVGKRCFIVAMGPSLTYSDLDKIQGEYSFSMNSIVKVLNEISWKPTYYGIQDHLVYEKLEAEILKISGIKVFIADVILKKGFKCSPNALIFPLSFYKHYYAYKKVKYSTRFSSDVSALVYDGYSITYSLLQIAIYMGFKDIYLLGCDCNYSSNPTKQHFVESGHFDPAYASVGDKMIYAFQQAKIYADKHNISIYNATRGGKLEIFQRVDLDKVIFE